MTNEEIMKAFDKVFHPSEPEKTIRTKLAVRHFPDRIKPCLCIEQDNKTIILATFKNKECEDLFCDFINGNCMTTYMREIFENERGE